MLTAVCPYT